MTKALQLKQVVMFSRHGIRTPLPNTINLLQTVTPKKWPQWHCAPGYLTTRGGTLESYFGDYFGQWLQQHQFAVSANDVYVYANSLQRTVATAQYFTLGAFAGLDVPIHHKHAIEQMDDVFNPVIRNSSVEFNAAVVEDLRRYSGSTQLIEQLDQKLMPAYDLLAEILDYQHSALYQQYQCQFAQLPTCLDLVSGQEPILQGPLALGTAIADAFTLQHYSGFAKQDVAWGMIETPEQWQMITDLKNHYINLLFKSPVLAKHMARPLVELIYSVFKTRQHKLTMLVGHDSNIASLFGALNMTHDPLPLQFEETPIGGKLLFCRWHDSQTAQDYFSAEYVYPTDEQLHHAIPISRTAPPEHIKLTLADLEPNQQGLYLWYDVLQKIAHYINSVNADNF